VGAKFAEGAADTAGGPRGVGAEVLSWVRSHQIAYAKATQKARWSDRRDSRASAQESRPPGETP